MFCELEDLRNESDVEQKFVLPFLTECKPTGLGYSSADYFTKSDIRKLTIDKGRAGKLYYPDYVLVSRGHPIAVIEAKHPKESLTEGFREARLYATELNALYPADINPCTKVVAVNGAELWVGQYDNASPSLRVAHSEMSPTGDDYTRVVDELSKDSLSAVASAIIQESRGQSEYLRPTNLFGGVHAREDLPENSFGGTLILDNKELFSPETEKSRNNIAKHAYVTSGRRLKHVTAVESFIQKDASLLSSKHTTKISDTANPANLISSLREHVPDTEGSRLLLLIGGVGAGKSTFCDYVRAVRLPPDLVERTLWIRIDLNNAPLTKDKIYDWVKEKIVSQLKASEEKTDFSSLEEIQRVFSHEIAEIKNGALRLLKDDRDAHNTALYREISELTKDLDKYVQALSRYLCANRDRRLVLVLDNCDKRNRDEQLLMFSVAKWLQEIISCIIFMPMRDTTFDHHRKEPPLDTVVKDLTYRIDPPNLKEVLQARINYASRTMNESPERKRHFMMGEIPVSYSAGDQIRFLQSIMSSLFGNTLFRSLLAGIAGRDIRRGLEIFVDFCKSGHIDTSEIVKIISTEDELYTLENHLISRVFFKGTNRFYHDANSSVKNVFFSEPNEDLPNPFCRMAILAWLEKRRHERGPGGFKGYHCIADLLQCLVRDGFDECTIQKQTDALVRASCILTESLATKPLNYERELVSISPSGVVIHGLISSLEYLACCSENVWYKDQDAAKEIARRIVGDEANSYVTTVLNAKGLIDYLVAYKDMHYPKLDSFVAVENLVSLDSAILTVTKAYEKLKASKPPKEVILQEYPIGSQHTGVVITNREHEVFVNLGRNIKGCIPKGLREGGSPPDDLSDGVEVQVVVKEFSEQHGRLTLIFAEPESLQSADD